MDDKPLIIYHFPCHDGFAAAYAAWRKFGDNAEYFPTNYDKPVPDVTDREVYILDFSFKKPVLEKILSTAKHVTWLDHHKTAFEEWLGEVPYSGNFMQQTEISLIKLDNYKSGCMLAWEHFNPSSIVPPYLFIHTQDRDLWLFKHVNTKPFMQHLTLTEYDFAEWHKLATMREVDYLAYVREGEILVEQFNKQVKDIVRSTKQKCTINKLFKGLAANVSPTFQSEAGNMLAAECGTFGLLWYVSSRGTINCSLRSQGEYDVSKIAKVFGGGGHRTAAGFQLSSFRELEKFFDA